jgi:hypothetical protein
MGVIVQLCDDFHLTGDAPLSHPDVALGLGKRVFGLVHVTLAPHPLLFGKPSSTGPLPALWPSSKTGSPDAAFAPSNTGVLKSKPRCPEGLPGFTAAVFENYCKQFSTKGIMRL